MFTRRHCEFSGARRSRGLSLVELLVAVAISLIASIAIFQVFAVYEGQKRTTTSGGDAQTNAALGLFTIERDVRMAGYGLNSLDFLGCVINGWDEQAGGGTAFTLTFVPVLITQGAAGAPDTVEVLYGNGDLLPNPANITQNMPDPAAVYKVSNRYGFQEGNLVVAAETGKPCTLAQASNLPGTLGDTDNVIHASGTYTDPNTGAQIPTRYNKPAGLGTAYTTNGKLFNLGSLPLDNVYSVQNGQLMLQQRLSGPTTLAAQAIFDGIVQIQAQYGKDLVGNDGIVDTFDEVTPATQAAWTQVLAVRIAVVARASQYEKEEVSPATIKLWPDSAVAPTTVGPVWTLTADDRHYRYKVFQTTVPLRNMIWKP